MKGPESHLEGERVLGPGAQQGEDVTETILSTSKSLADRSCSHHKERMLTSQDRRVS